MLEAIGFPRSVLVCTLCLFTLAGSACSFESERAPGSEGTTHESRSSSAFEDAQGGMSSGDPTPTNPEDDPAIAFVKEYGFEGLNFPLECRSIGEDGSVVDGAGRDELPVGGGRHIECRVTSFSSQAATEFMSWAQERWCALGKYKSSVPGGDSRLNVRITIGPGPEGGTLLATHEGDAITIRKVDGFGGKAWPIWVKATYSVSTVQPRNAQMQSCEAQFGI